MKLAMDKGDGGNSMGAYGGGGDSGGSAKKIYSKSEKPVITIVLIIIILTGGIDLLWNVVVGFLGFIGNL